MINIERHVVGVLQTNCYVIEDKDTENLAIIDPGDASDEVIRKIVKNRENKFLYILLTHGHFDHITTADKYRTMTKAKICIGMEENEFTSNNDLNMSSSFLKKGISPFSADVLLKNGENISLGNAKIKVMFTPGHTKGSVCYLVDDCIFSGDTLMKGVIGRTDLITGDFSQIKQSLKTLADIDGDYTVYPGHGDLTTLKYERYNNVYLGNAYDNDLY